MSDEQKAYENVKKSNLGGQNKRPKCKKPIKVSDKIKAARGTYDPEAVIK